MWLLGKWRERRQWQRYGTIFQRYHEFTMVGKYHFGANLFLCEQKAPATGCVVECGVWRGGMSAGIADVLGGRLHYLFDSFEGLPPAKEIDGEAAKKWQADTNAPNYYDNCRAETSFAARVMDMSRAGRHVLIEGWFDQTVPQFKPEQPIAVLRLDGDWYDSTLVCLKGLYPYVSAGGLIIIDDYYTWDGCSRAVHDFLAEGKMAERIRTGPYGVCYLQKREAVSENENRTG